MIDKPILKKFIVQLECIVAEQGESQGEEMFVQLEVNAKDSEAAMQTFGRALLAALSS